LESITRESLQTIPCNFREGIYDFLYSSHLYWMSDPDGRTPDDINPIDGSQSNAKEHKRIRKQ
jgi:hypothetical protein